jgi:predicted nucleotidyltransferase
MIALIEEHRAEIAALCREFGVRRLEVFGSAAIGTFNPETSDIDFLVDFEDRSPGIARRWLALEAELAELLHIPVDLVIAESVRNPYLRRAIDRHRECIYERSNREAVA